MKIRIKFCVTIVAFFSIAILTSAQIGRQFWFVAPDVSSSHSDKPIVLRITTLDQPATVTISMPANSGFAVITRTIAAKTQLSEVLTPFLELIENNPSNTINNKGLLITSTADISAYYEVASTNNPDKYSLKGNNALGKSFFVPSQNLYQNHSYPSNQPKERVDIVATEDNTVVTINPKVDAVGHLANVPFTVTLNRGQSYCLEAMSIAGSDSFAGTEITSTKNIAVTISDDSIETSLQGGWDLIGDQLIPVTVIGTEYIAVKSNDVTGSIHKVFVLATEDDTYVTIDGDINLITKLNKGEQRSYDITNDAIFISSDKPVYAYQVTSMKKKGDGQEMGSAILPAITCTGSRSVSFTRILEGRFWVQLLVQGKNKDGFTLRGNGQANYPNIISSINGLWKPVAGTGINPDERWFSALVPMSTYTGTDAITTTIPYYFDNSKGLFHLGVFDENNSSISFGYFSAYNSLVIGGPTQNCQGETITLTAPSEMLSYSWFYQPIGSKVATSIGAGQTISATKTGNYWVKDILSPPQCQISDTINVAFNFPDFSLDKDTTICPEVEMTLSGPAGFSAYKWSTGATATSIMVTTAPSTTSTTWLKITDAQGCSKQDTMKITAYPAAVLNINLVPSAVCLGDTIRNTTNMTHYQWQFNNTAINKADTLNYKVAKLSGDYKLTGWTNNQCSLKDTKKITVNPLPTVVLADKSTCKGTSGIFTLSGFSSTSWWSELNLPHVNSQITVSQPQTVWVKATDNKGCSAVDSALFTWYKTAVDFGADTSVCQGYNIDIKADITMNNYTWKFDNGSSVTNLNNPSSQYSIVNALPSSHQGKYIVSANDLNGCNVVDTFNLAVTPVPSLNLGGPNKNICFGNDIKIVGNNTFKTYSWTFDDKNGGGAVPFGNNLEILVSNPGIYTLTATQANGCSKTEWVDVNVLAPITVDLVDNFSVCPYDTIIPLSIVTDVPFPKAVYEWSYNGTDTTTTIPTLNVKTKGKYTLTAYDTNDCFARDEVEVSFYSLLPLTLKDSTICDNETMNMVSPYAIPADIRSYQWSNETTATPGPVSSDWTVNAKGQYKLSIIDNNGINGCVIDATMMLYHKASPVFDLGLDNRFMCPGDTILVAVEPTYDWYMWNDDSTDNLNFKITTVAGPYKMTIGNKNTCVTSKTVNINLHTPEPVNLVADSVCSGFTQLLDSAPTGMQSYLWSTGDTTQSITASRGKYSVIIKDTHNCYNTGSINVGWYSIPQVNLGPDEVVCPLAQVVLDAGSGFDKYDWHNGSITQSTVANILDTVNLVSVTDKKGCVGFDTKLVSYLDTPPYKLLGDTIVCSNDSLTFDASEGLALDYTNFLWSDGSTDPVKTIKNAGEYRVTASSSCFILGDTINIIVNEAPEAQLDTSVFKQVRILPEGGTMPYKFSIDFGRWQNDNTFRFLENGTYIFGVQDANLCVDTATIVLFNTLDMDIPNFFTPNGDGNNDTWIVKGLERFPDSKVWIYDRYGKLITIYSPSSSGWDGTYNGRPVPSDDYWYNIDLVNAKKTIRGNLTIKR